MGDFEDKDRDNKSDKPVSGQGQQSQKPGSSNEPGRESNEPREGQSSGSERPGGRSKSENEEEPA